MDTNGNRKHCTDTLLSRLETEEMKRFAQICVLAFRRRGPSLDHKNGDQVSFEQTRKHTHNHSHTAHIHSNLSKVSEV